MSAKKHWTEYDFLYYPAVAIVYVVTIGGALVVAALFSHYFLG